jgi:hypothetical protein
VEKYFVSRRVGGRVFFSIFVEVFTLREANVEATFPCTASLEPVFAFAGFFVTVGAVFTGRRYVVICVCLAIRFVLLYFLVG